MWYQGAPSSILIIYWKGPTSLPSNPQRSPLAARHEPRLPSQAPRTCFSASSKSPRLFLTTSELGPVWSCWICHDPYMDFFWMGAPSNHLELDQFVLKPMVTWRPMRKPHLSHWQHCTSADRLGPCRATIASPSWTARWVSLYAECQPPGQLVHSLHSGSSFYMSWTTPQSFPRKKELFWHAATAPKTQLFLDKVWLPLAVACCDYKINVTLIFTNMDQYDQLSYTTKYKTH